MNALIYVFRFLYRIRMWLLTLPLLVAILVYMMLGKGGGVYEVNTTIYTGVVSGFDVESSGAARTDWNATNNAIDNLINIITAQTTLKHVSMRLYAQHMMYGDPNNDNNYIKASNYRAIYARTPPEVRALIDKTSEERTLANLYAYEQASPKNFVYGLFNYSHRHYSYEALSRIIVRRLGNSDMLDIMYVSDDPGIAYYTLVILNEEFIKQYEELRFGETNNVIEYFRRELARVGAELRASEDSLTRYNVQKRVINYDEQTKHIASLSRDMELRLQEILLAYNGSMRIIEEMEERTELHTQNLRNNSLFVNKLNTISELTARIAEVESFQADSVSRWEGNMDMMRRQLAEAEEDFKQFVETITNQQYTKEGISTTTFVGEWVVQLIRFEKAKAELEVMHDRLNLLDQQYVYFSPIGSTIKRMEREIGFTERNYLSFLESLNTALLRQKKLQMTSATLKIINPPIFPIAAMPTKRKLMVLGAFIGAMAFIIGCFIIIEMLDRTLRDKLRSERLTGNQVLGAFPKKGKLRFRAYDTECKDIAVHYMNNAIMPYLKSGGLNIINILSTSNNDGKSYISTQLTEYWESVGIKARHISWHEDFEVESKEFMLANKLSDLYKAQGEDIVIVEYPALQQTSIPSSLLREASINILAARADKAWNDMDQILLDKVKEQIDGQSPVFIYLTQAEREAVQNFTGLLPPYNYVRRLGYRFYQFGLTSSDK